MMLQNWDKDEVYRVYDGIKTRFTECMMIQNWDKDEVYECMMMQN